MKQPKRYALVARYTPSGVFQAMEENDRGEWVKYEEHKEFLKENEEIDPSWHLSFPT